MVRSEKCSRKSWDFRRATIAFDSAFKEIELMANCKFRERQVGFNGAHVELLRWIGSHYFRLVREGGTSVLGRATNASIRRHSGCFCRWGECRRIFPDELLHTQRLLPSQCAHVVRRPVEAPRAMQIAQRCQVVHQVNRPAPL
jgi:hypothetical protein